MNFETLLLSSVANYTECTVDSRFGGFNHNIDEVAVTDGMDATVRGDVQMVTEVVASIECGGTLTVPGPDCSRLIADTIGIIITILVPNKTVSGASRGASLIHYVFLRPCLLQELLR